MRLDEHRKYRSLSRPDDRHDRRGNERFPGAPPFFPEAVHAECEARLVAITRDIRHPDWDRAGLALHTLRRRKPGRQRQGMVSVWASAPEAMMLGDVLRAVHCFPAALEDLDRIAQRPVPPGVPVEIVPGDFDRYLNELGAEAASPEAREALAILRGAHIQRCIPRVYVRPGPAGILAAALRAIGGYPPTVRHLEQIAASAAPVPAAPGAA